MLHFGYARINNCAESLIFVEPTLQPSFCQIVMASYGINQEGPGPMYTESLPLNDPYPEHVVDPSAGPRLPGEQFAPLAAFPLRFSLASFVRLLGNPTVARW